MKIDIYQDTVCPWCRIGKAHLQQALSQWTKEPVELAYHAFLLDPTTPPEGRAMSTLVQKLGGQTAADAMHARVCQIGEACDVDFQFDRIDRIPNTVQSHYLVQATPTDRQEEMLEAVYKAYFEEGRDIGQVDVLLDVASALGYEPEATRQAMDSAEVQGRVEADFAFARDAGISGVPFFVFNHRYALSGAQPVEAFLEVLDQVHAAS